MKTCRICHKEKPLSEFHRDRTRTDGLDGRCKPCNISRVGEWAKNNGERVRRRSRAQTIRAYGLTVEDFDLMAQEQDWRCGICRQRKPLVVDHCHTTGRVRGLLCRHCNSGIGFLSDDVARLRAAVAYLAG